MNVHTDPLIDDYLRRLDAAASALPPYRRDELVSEIRDHLQEALRQIPADDKAAVRNVLERLGPPEEIAAAADAPPPGQLAAGFSQTSGLAIASLLLAVLWFVGIGAVLALVFGYRARREIKNSGGRLTGSGLATAGIILGWIGIAALLPGVILVLQAGPFLTLLFLAAIGAVLALVSGYRRRREIKNSGGRLTGSGQATARIILGWIGIAIVVAGALLVLRVLSEDSPGPQSSAGVAPTWISTSPAAAATGMPAEVS